MLVSNQFPSSVAARKYIHERGYASYSSLNHFCNGTDPADRGDMNSPAFRFGKELHSRFLEKNTLEILSPPEEKLLTAMITSLNKNKMVQQLMNLVYVEVGFIHPLCGVPIKGYLDIFKPLKYVGDLKSTSQTTKAGFQASMDFLQPALYLMITNVPEFYYIGISKKPPHEVFILRFSKKNLKHYITQVKEILDEVKLAL